MKIGPNLPDGLRVGGTATPVDTKAMRTRATSEPVGDIEPTDRVSLTKSSPGLLTGAARAPFDETKVEEVRRAIAEGRFPVDARKVADQLLRDAAELLGLQRAQK